MVSEPQPVEVGTEATKVTYTSSRLVEVNTEATDTSSRPVDDFTRLVEIEIGATNSIRPVDRAHAKDISEETVEDPPFSIP